MGGRVYDLSEPIIMSHSPVQGLVHALTCDLVLVKHGGGGWESLVDGGMRRSYLPIKSDTRKR